LSWRARSASAQRIELDVKPLRDMPPGGVVIRGPWPGSARVFIDGRPAGVAGEEIRLRRTPARVRIETRGL
jgi:hypothetical protein